VNRLVDVLRPQYLVQLTFESRPLPRPNDCLVRVSVTRAAARDRLQSLHSSPRGSLGSWLDGEQRARCSQNEGMDDIGAKERVAGFLATQDAQTLAQTLLELAEDCPAVYQRLERLRLRDDPAALVALFAERLQRWESDDRYIGWRDSSAFGRDLNEWVTQVQRETLPKFPGEAMKLFEAFLHLDRVVFERVDDDGGNVGGSFELACQLWLTAAEAAGMSAAEIDRRASVLLAKDGYGARRALSNANDRRREGGDGR
jgi:hypothetical protein